MALPQRSLQQCTSKDFRGVLTEHRIAGSMRALAMPMKTGNLAGICGRWRALKWSRRQESNLYLPLRRRPFYPLNYGEREGFSHGDTR
jgi:hypothetical protein